MSTDYHFHKKPTPWLKWSADLRQGNVREYMEDRIVLDSFTIDNCTIYVQALLDGHGGSDVVEYVQKQLPIALHHFMKEKSGVREAIHKTFVHLNQKVQGMEAGTTVSLLCLQHDKKKNKLRCYMANVGDSTVYGVKNAYAYRKYNSKKKRDKALKQESTVVRLSVDHKPELVSEQKRMETHKKIYKGVDDGYVVNSNGHMLAMTRAIGDPDFGEVVSSEPYIRRLDTQYDIFILASDGLWDVMDHKKVWNEINDPKCLRAWKESAKRLNDLRHSKFEQHDNTSLLLVYVDWEALAGTSGSDSSSVQVALKSEEPTCEDEKEKK